MDALAVITGQFCLAHKLKVQSWSVFTPYRCVAQPPDKCQDKNEEWCRTSEEGDICDRNPWVAANDCQKTCGNCDCKFSKAVLCILCCNHFYFRS